MEKIYIIPSKTSKLHIWKTYKPEQEHKDRIRDHKNNSYIAVPPAPKGQIRIDSIGEHGYCFALNKHLKSDIYALIFICGNQIISVVNLENGHILEPKDLIF